MNYEIGSRIGDYEILQIVGAGGMGRVYKVRNTISDRIEAMKVLLPDLEGKHELADRFMREIKVQASLDHPNIAALHTALRIENQLMMLMEFVEGTTLDKMMETGPVPIDKAVDYIAQVLSALSYAHARGVIHRDLKPANMMVTAGGQVKLMDFGIAKMTADRKLTQTGSTVGSLYYMSPEQIKGVLDLDPRSDLYSLGVSLYEIVTGARPFQGDSEYSIMAAHLEKNPPPPVQILPNLPPGLSEVILQALEKDPAKRFQTADAFRNALVHVCNVGQIPAAVPSPTKATARPVETARPAQAAPKVPPPPAHAAPDRRGLWIAIGAVLVVVVIVAAAVQLPKFRHSAAENAPAAAPAAAPASVAQPPESSPAPDATLSQVPTTPSSVQEPPQAPVAATAPQSAAVARAATTPSSTPARAPRSGTSAKSNLAQPSALEIQAPPSAQPVSAPSRPEPVQSPQPAAAPAGNAKTAEHLAEVREQLNLLSIRVETVRSGLDRLQRQQSASGFGLRSDMTSSAQRMEYYVTQTDAALNRRDAEAAKKNLDLAEREVSKLENFLGR